MRDRNEWFKEAKGALRHLEIEAVENPFAWPTVTCVADGEGMSSTARSAERSFK